MAKQNRRYLTKRALKRDEVATIDDDSLDCCDESTARKKKKKKHVQQVERDFGCSA